MTDHFRQNLIIAIIGVVGVIIGASIGILPQLIKSDDKELIVKIEEIKKKQANNWQRIPPQFRQGTREDGYISSVISCLANLAEIKKGVKIKSEINIDDDGNILSDKVRTLVNLELSDNIQVRQLVYLEDFDVKGINIQLFVTTDFNEDYKDELFEVRDWVLINRPKKFPFIDLEHYMNQMGAYIVKSEFKKSDKGYTEVITKIKYELKEKKDTKIIEVEGFGIYYP